MNSDKTGDFGSFYNSDVVARILDTFRDNTNVGPETISCDACLSRPQTNDYLSLMAKNDLLRYNPTTGTYRSTKKGATFLRTYRQMGVFIDLIDEEIGL